MLSLLRLERKQKNSSNPFRIRIFLFLSYSFGIETINTFIHSRSSLENHTRFGQNVHPFSDQKGAKTLPDGAAHTYIAYIREYPPGTFCSIVRSTGRDLHLFLAIFSIFAKHFTLPCRYLKLSRQTRHATEKLRKYDQ